jgi:hypothetical protein
MGSNTVILLGDVAERTDRLEVVCRKCDRHECHPTRGGTWRQLRHARATPLAGDCERFKTGKAHDQKNTTYLGPPKKPASGQDRQDQHERRGTHGAIPE